MADEAQDVVQPEESGELDAEAEAPESSEGRRVRLRDRVSGVLRRLASPIVWLWSRVARGWRWLRKPNEVGQPVTLQPRGVRLLVLLIMCNLVVLVLLTVALYKAAMAPPIEGPPQVVVATATPAASSTPGPSPTPFGSGGAIAFTLRRNGNADIYAINQAERQLVRLTYDPAEDRDPAWSPDGDAIAFASNRADNWDIYLLDLVSGALIRLTQHAGFDANPSWSPDGEYIAFESYRYGNLDIYVMSTSGGQVQRITTDRAPDYEPAWSPDSRAIAFTSFRDGNKDIYLYLIDEEEVINLTNSPDVDEGTPSWSPDGTQLAYVSGSRGNPSIQVATFNWDTMAADQAQTELLNAGASPAWAPDGQNLIYAVYEQGERSHLIAASMKGWALSQEVYSTDGLMDDMVWTSLALSPRVIARAQAREPAETSPLYVELVQPTPRAVPPYSLVSLPDVNTAGTAGTEAMPEATSAVEEEKEEGEKGEGKKGEEEEEREEGEEEEGEEGEEEQEEREEETTEEPPQEVSLSDAVNESFSALRQRVVEEAGWDYLANLSSAWLPMNHTPPSGQSRMTWHVCGRAVGLDQEPYEENQPRVELVREDVGNVTYWRVFIRADEQDGSMGEPLREAVWDLNAREEGGRALVEGGALKERIPAGYYVDFTTLASDYGWERVPSLWRWRYFWPDIRWWELEKTDGLTWWDCMLEVFEPEQIEKSFGPIPGYED
jgi:Tol biopolymer transport system component